jgi:hypothetical protein
MTPDEVAVQLLARVGHVHIATAPDGWHCFTYTLLPGGDDEVLCGDGASIAEALETVLAQTQSGSSAGSADDAR